MPRGRGGEDRPLQRFDRGEAVVRATLAGFALLLTAGPAWAAFIEITDGYSTFRFDTTEPPPAGNNTQLFTGGDPGNDVLFAHFNHLRVGGTTFALANGTVANAAGNSATVTYSSVGGVFDVSTTYVVSSLGGGPVLDVLTTVRNVAGGSLSGRLFDYFDPDLLGFDTDTAVASLNPFPAIQLSNSVSGRTATLSSPTAGAYQLSPYSALIDGIHNGSIPSLDNTGSPFAPGDITAAFGTDFTLAAGGSRSFSSNFTAAAVPNPAAVPEPSSLALLGILGGVAALRLRRRNRRAIAG